MEKVGYTLPRTLSLVLAPSRTRAPTWCIAHAPYVRYLCGVCSSIEGFSGRYTGSHCDVLVLYIYYCSTIYSCPVRVV
jgi:hypothetical protein